MVEGSRRTRNRMVKEAERSRKATKLIKLREQIETRKIAGERGIDLPEGSQRKYYKIWKVVKALGWEEFVKEPIEPCLELVKEFYVNLPAAEDHKCMVFGIPVSYSQDSIKNLYGLPTVHEEEDGFSQMKRRNCDFSHSELVNTLTFGGPPNYISEKTQTLPHASLVDEAQFWRRFLTGRVLGIMNNSESSKEIQKLLFVILTRRRFDVSRIIVDLLAKHKKSLLSGNFRRIALSYPSTITALCLKAGVQFPPGAVMIRNDQSCGQNFLGEDPRDVISAYAWHNHFYGSRGSDGFESPVFERKTHILPPVEECPYEENETEIARRFPEFSIPSLVLPDLEGTGPSHGQWLLNWEAPADKLKWLQDRQRFHQQEFERDQKFWNDYFQGNHQERGS